MSKTAKTPKLRFKGFTDAWEQCELHSIADVFDGVHQTPKYTNSGVMFLSVENIKTLTSKKFISIKDFQRDFQVSPKKGDILMTRIGDIGTANVIETKCPLAYYVSLALLKPTNVDSYFLKEIIASSSVQNELWHRTLHIAFPKKINKGEIGKINLTISLKTQEQKKVGALFTTLNTLITLHQRKPP